MNEILTSIRKQLKSAADESTRESGKRFFKESINLYGVKTADVSKIAKNELQKLSSLSKHEIFNLCEELWKSGYIEESFIACNWSYAMHKQFEPDDFFVFERWIQTYVTNWASCDTLCNHTVGECIQMFPENVLKLVDWTQSDNRWVRRAAAVTFIIPARKGLFLNVIFEIAEKLLLDSDDLVQKGYGWMLKAASQAHQDEVFKFVMQQKAHMPRTALRYAIEKMSPALKKTAMKK